MSCNTPEFTDLIRMEVQLSVQYGRGREDGSSGQFNYIQSGIDIDDR